jgi:hypothetical protein
MEAMSQLPNLSGVRLLLILREMGETDWTSLCSKLGINPDFPLGKGFESVPSVILFGQLTALRDVGLIAYEGKHPSVDTHSKIRLTDELIKLRTALGVGLSTLARATDPAAMIVTPHFGRPSKTISKTDVFVLMPFTDALQSVYEDHIVTSCKGLGLTVSRGDDFFTAHAVMQDVWTASCAAQVIIADCTGRNPNVFYEIGLSHAVGKPVVLITQNIDDVPFDLKHIRYIHYEFTPRGMQRFETALSRTIASLLNLP